MDAVPYAMMVNQKRTSKQGRTAPNITTERSGKIMLTNKKRILSIALALVLAFSAFSGMAFAAPPQNSGYTTDEWTNATPPVAVFDETVASWQTQTVTFRVVPTISATSDVPSGFATVGDAQAVSWSLPGYVGNVSIVSTDVVPAENYNAPSGSFASQVTLSVPYGNTTEDMGVYAADSSGNNFAYFTLHVIANKGQYLEGNALPPPPNNSDNANCSTYLMETEAYASANVTFVIEAGDAVIDFEAQPNTRFRYVEAVAATASDPRVGVTVTDVLLAYMQTYGNVVFYDGNGNIITPSSSYVGTVKTDNAAWEAGQIGLDGWVFRVNDKVPVQATDDGLGYEGMSILQTKVQNGDIVHFFYDFPSDLDGDSGNIAANYVRAFPTAAATSSSLTVQLQGHKTYIDPLNNYMFNIYNYVNLGADVIATVVDDNGRAIQERSDANGTVTFGGAFTPGNSYTVETAATYYTNEDWDFLDYAYFILTGAYSKVTA
jgi:hypothetical protein